MLKIFTILAMTFTFSAWALPTPEELLIEANSLDWNDAVTTTIKINAPVSVVWKYASDSTKANDWSIYFDHISPLPGIPDGKIGALRRCFRNKDETGPYWDEVTTESVPETRRQITTYGLKNFPMNFLSDGQYVFVRQLYKAIDDKTTEMTFQARTSPSRTWMGRLAFWFSKGETSRIFLANLENIKANIEGTPRPHPWEAD